IPDCCASDVNAVCRNQFVVGREIDGRNRVFAPVAATLCRCADDAEAAAKQDAGSTNAALLQQLPNAAARDGIMANLHLAVNLDVESQLASELGEAIDSSLRSVSEVKVGALVDFLCLKAIDNDLLCEFLGRLA